ncbi:MAG: hypothetical protein JW910_15225 [Anaerolineae bacterium]|nr:hypothetical protein [Anaerolineae bacterium]
MSRRILLLLVVVLLLGLTGCGDDSTAPLPTAAPQQGGPPPTAPYEVVTLPPVVTATPTPLPTLDFDIDPFSGPWQVMLRFVFDDGDPIRQTRFVGGATLEVDEEGGVSGQDVLATAVRHDGCLATIEDDGEIPFTVRGNLRQTEGVLEVAFTLVPDAPNRQESYRLFCPDFQYPLLFERQTLWPAVTALGVQPFVLPLQAGARLENVYDVAGPTNMLLTGTLTIEIMLRR